MQISQKGFRRTGVALAAFIGVATVAGGAAAAPITFNFNGITTNLDSNSSTGRNTIENYMNGVLGDHGAVDVRSGVASRSYTGDGHVVGPTVSYSRTGPDYVGDLPSGSYPLQSNHVVPLTLGNTDGCSGTNSTCSVNGSKDTFLKNAGGTSGSNDRIKLTFTDMKIISLAFDYEIFPDGSNEQPPDFSLVINGITVDLNTASADTSLFGIAPGDDGTYTHSPDSGVYHTEGSKQLLGTTGTITLSQDIIDSEQCTAGDTGCTVVVEFVDWPQTIGIDNLALTTYTPPPPPPQRDVPAPPALSLFLAGLGGLGFLRRRRRAA